jgi:hypothetical protein
MNEARLRQGSLRLGEGPQRSLPTDIEERALELLVQLLIGVMAAIEGGSHDEQNHR